MSEITGQDEARRALAEALDYFRPHWLTNGPVMLTPEKMRQNLAVIEAALRAPSLDRGAEEMRERAKIACLDLNDAYREAAENHMQARNSTKAREAMDWAIGALECAHAVAKLPPPLPVPADLNERGGK